MSKDIFTSEHSEDSKPNVEEISIESDEKKAARARTFFGKRFARRAKRWAEIQQRRQSTASDPTDSPSPELESVTEPPKYRKQVQKHYYANPRHFTYNRSTFSPQDYFIQYPLPKGYIFYNPSIAWNDCYYCPSQLIHGLSNLNFSTQEPGYESPHSLSSTSSLSTSYSSQYSFDNDHSEQSVNNFQQPTISAETRKLCSELFLVPESKCSELLIV